MFWSQLQIAYFLDLDNLGYLRLPHSNKRAKFMIVKNVKLNRSVCIQSWPFSSLVLVPIFPIRLHGLGGLVQDASDLGARNAAAAGLAKPV
jgi:hypothetical protein